MGSPVGAWAVTIVRYAALFALLGGIATIVVGLYTMTPETANGRGSIPVISDGTLPVDLAPEPVGINDVPGAKGAMESVGGTVGKGVDAVDSGAKARRGRSKLGCETLDRFLAKAKTERNSI